MAGRPPRASRADKMPLSSSKKVCVVGAGPAGLASARELRREGHAVSVVEQSHGVGGQWLYDVPSGGGGDPLGAAGVHSSVYASLRLNTPRESMGFSDFPFYAKSDGDARRFPGHREFLRYIRDFCDAFGLMDAIRLNTRVLRVAKTPREGGDDDCLKWAVRTAQGEVVTEEVFDAVVVASGHYSQPWLPTITGADKWSRRQLHCHSYRVPDPFQDEVVVIVGCQESGKDIALELCKVANEVHLSVKSMEAEAIAAGLARALSKHDNLHAHLQIDCLCEDGRVVFADGSWVVADTIIYCTGYCYSFPFLETEGTVTVDDDDVGPLFEHVFPPSLSFVGICSKAQEDYFRTTARCNQQRKLRKRINLSRLSSISINFQVIVPLFFEVQARWVAQVLSGRRTLPSEEEMLRSAEEYRRSREMAGLPKRRAHDIFDLEYCDEYGEKHCGFPRTEEWKKELMWSSFMSNHDDFETFRDDFHDSDLVRKGLRSQGWLPLASAPPQEEEEEEEEEEEGGVGAMIAAAAAAPSDPL